MTRFDSILLPLDGSPASAKAVGCAVWLSQRLGATLHVLHSTPRPVRSEDALDRLCAAETRRTTTVLHQTAREPVAAALAATTDHDVKLVVMTARGGSRSAGVDPDRRLGRVAAAILECSTLPLLLLPLRYREALPWRSVLVAASGEVAADRALATAVELTFALGLTVSATYVEEARAAHLAAYADAPQYEYPRRLEELVRRATTGPLANERGCVQEARVRRGEPATELLAEIERTGTSVLALGCHGALGPTRALVLKRLLDRAECPLLVTHHATEAGVRLKVGPAIGEL